MVLEKTLESPLDCKDIKPVSLKRKQPWIFIGKTDAEAETPILWPSDRKSPPIRKDPVAGKDRRQEEKGTIEDETVEWHHRLNGHESEQIPGDGEGQGSLAYCSPWDYKELDTTEWLSNNNISKAALMLSKYLLKKYLKCWTFCVVWLTFYFFCFIFQNLEVSAYYFLQL